MSDKRISGLTELAETPATGDLFIIADVSDTTEDKKITWSTIRDGIATYLASLTQTLTNKTLTSPKINEDVAVTATATELNYVDGVTSAIQTQLNAKAADADVVHDTGNETIAGIKTFSSDPLIPDEVYGAGWNGSLEPPTKNAVYDKIETIGGGGSGTFYFPQPVGIQNGLSTGGISGNTNGFVHAFILPFAFVVDKLTIYVTAVGAAGTLDIGIYSEDGQTKEIDITTASISAAGIVTTAVAAVSLSAGIHYMVIVPNSTANVTARVLAAGFSHDIQTADTEPVNYGLMVVTDSTLPTTFNPITDIIPGGDDSQRVFRIDT